MKAAIGSFDPLMVGRSVTRDEAENARAEDAAIFEGLVRLHETRVLALAHRLLLNRAAAHDAAQEVFIRLYKHLDKMREDRDAGAWLYRTTVNVCLDLMRRSKNDLPLDVASEAPDRSVNPEENAAGNEEKRLVLAALKELTPREREAVVLRDLQGCTTAEVAQIMRTTEGTVRSHISTGRLKIKEYVVARRRGRNE
jgi:RNA polymerase sigma-70 factor (ECF subfamily)